MTKISKSDKFLKLVGKHKEKKKDKKFSGTLEDYLKVIEDNPGVTQLAHKRLYEAIAKEGITKMSSSDVRCNKLFGGATIKTYDYPQNIDLRKIQLKSIVKEDKNEKPKLVDYTNTIECKIVKIVTEGCIMTDSKTIEKLLNEQIDSRNIYIDDFVKIDWEESWEGNEFSGITADDDRNIYLDTISEQTVTIQNLKKLLQKAKEHEENVITLRRSPAE